LAALQVNNQGDAMRSFELRLFVVGLLMVVSLLSSTAHGQTKSLAQLQAELVSSWLVSVDGEGRTRTLIISGVAQKSDEEFVLESVYGMSDTKQTAIKAEYRISAKDRQLILITQADTRIVATLTPDGIYKGTFTLKNGNVKDVAIRKVSGEEISALRSASSDPLSVIQKPAADVPAACAAFSGVWTGIWPGAGRTWLWITGVNNQCAVSYSYGAASATPKLFKTAEIKNSVLTIPRPNGATVFEVSGNEVVGRYSGSDGSNSASMQKVDLTDGTLDKLRGEQRLANAVVRPGADVPAGCAAFFGVWSGTWSQGNFGAQWLRVAGVDSGCVARYSYRGSNTVPGSYEVKEIKDEKLSFVCNPSTGGTCIFSLHGDELWGSYSNPSGGTNSGVFRKIP
jgi:hypothetical protein